MDLSKANVLFPIASEIEGHAVKGRWLLVEMELHKLSDYEREEVLALIDKYSNRMTLEKSRQLRELSTNRRDLII